METPIGDDEDSHLGDFIEDTNAVLPIDAGDPVEPARDHARACSTRLTPREANACCACASASA
jgi:RNA polymerase primary sigma factor